LGGYRIATMSEVSALVSMLRDVLLSAGAHDVLITLIHDLGMVSKKA